MPARRQTPYKRCAFCGKYKLVISEFYTRKSGHPTANCIACNSEAAMYVNYKARYVKGTLDDIEKDLLVRLQMVRRVRDDMEKAS